MHRNLFILWLRPCENRNKHDWPGPCLMGHRSGGRIDQKNKGEGAGERKRENNWALSICQALCEVFSWVISCIPYHNLRRSTLLFFPLNEWVHWDPEKLSHVQGHISSRWESWGVYFNLSDVPFYVLNYCKISGWREVGRESGQRGREKRRARHWEWVHKYMGERDRNKDSLWDYVTTWRPCPGRRQMRSLNPSAQIGDSLGKVICKCHDAMRWNLLALVQAGTQAGTALCSLER